LVFQNEEKEKRAAELVVANKELVFQNEEKEKRAAELVVANKELVFQNEEKEKRAAELVIANKELSFQNEEKEKRAAELVVANKELVFQNEEKEKRAAELAQALDHAEAANRAKSAFLVNMTHELSTPMTVILGVTELALMSADPNQTELLTMVMKSSRKLHALMSDLIDMAVLESERMVLTELNFSLSEVIDDSLNEEKPAALAKGLQMSREIAAELPDIVCGDAVRLKQILNIFIGNAVKFSENGQITVRAQLLTDVGHSLLLRFSVTDQGIGVSALQQSQLFQTFVQIDGSSTRKYEGTGLGLALASRISRLMGGETGVISVMGSGSTFWATVRLRRATDGSVVR
jgi:signal transduction histidine kinase